MKLSQRGAALLIAVFAVGLVAGRYTSHTSDYQDMLRLSLSQYKECNSHLKQAVKALSLTSKILPSKRSGTRWKNSDTNTTQPTKE